MSGTYSRNKGMRNEYLLRDMLRLEGYTAHRVPSSGAAEGFKGDIAFKKDGKEWIAEVKSRKEHFKSLYEAYSKFGEFAVAIPVSNGPLLCVSVSASMDAALSNSAVYAPPGTDKVMAKAIRKLKSIQSMLQASDVLVVRDDRKPFLYVRYR
jgi:hypothetical protein